MVKGSLRTGLCSSVLLLSGCFPVLLGNYFKPEYADPAAKWLGDTCHGAVGAPSRIVLPLAERGQLTASIETGESGQAQALLLSLELPAGAGPDWGSGVLRWRAGPRTGSLPVPQAAAWRIMRWGDQEAVSAASLGLPAAAERPEITFSWSAVWKDVGQPAQFRMRLPQVVREGRVPAATEDVLLTAHKPPEASGDTRYYRTAAEHSAVQERQQACLAKGDPKKCSYVGEAERGFQITVAGVRWDGRAWLYRPAQGMPLRAELKGEVLGADLPWRMAVPAMVVPDLPTAQEQHQWISVKWLAELSQAIPVPVRTEIPAGGSNALRQTVRVPLPADLGDRFEIELPGRVLERPLRFERHRLDGGVMPFNC